MIVIGLTGSIGMGKTATARMFADEGVPVFDADAAVAALYARDGGAAAAVAGLVSDAVTDGAVDRVVLAAHLHRNPQDFAALEAIVHPMVAVARDRFIAAARARGADMVVLDTPLLFEAGLNADVDRVVVVSAPEAVQKARVLARPGMTDERLRAILARQTPDSEKRRRADFIVETGAGFEPARAQVRDLVRRLRAESGREPMAPDGGQAGA